MGCSLLGENPFSEVVNTDIPCLWYLTVTFLLPPPAAQVGPSDDEPPFKKRRTVGSSDSDKHSSGEGRENTPWRGPRLSEEGSFSPYGLMRALTSLTSRIRFAGCRGSLEKILG